MNMRSDKGYFEIQVKFFLMGTALLFGLLGIVYAAPNASASAQSTSWGWRYASWGSAYASLSDTRKTVSGADSDDKEDGYCVGVVAGIRNSANVFFGIIDVAGSTNCAASVNKTYSSTSPDSRYPYFCDVELVQGDSSDFAHYMTIWHDANWAADKCTL
jgi:hypothetical protein